VDYGSTARHQAALVLAPTTLRHLRADRVYLLADNRHAAEFYGDMDVVEID
jgi:hypothetical protein